MASVAGMLNEEGDNVDLYIPRKCSWTNRILRRDDRGAVQINVGHVDAKTGMYTGEFTPFCLSGFIRKKGEADLAISELVSKMDNKWPVEEF